jgi:hypothetical protein
MRRTVKLLERPLALLKRQLRQTYLPVARTVTQFLFDYSGSSSMDSSRTTVTTPFSLT